MLNLLLVSFFLWSVLLPSNSKKLYKRISSQGLPQMYLPVIGLVLFSYAAFYFFVSGLYAVNSSPKLIFDITLSLEFNYFKLVYVLVFLLLSYNYFIINHFIVSSIASYKKDKRHSIILFSGFLFFGLLFFFFFPSQYLSLIHI